MLSLPMCAFGFRVEACREALERRSTISDQRTPPSIGRSAGMALLSSVRPRVCVLLANSIGSFRSSAFQQLVRHLPIRRTNWERAIESPTSQSARMETDVESENYAASRSFFSFLSAMLRLRRLRWSMNRMPSRWSISCWMQVAISPSMSSSCVSPSRS